MEAFFSLFLNIFLFSLRMAFASLGSFVIIFKMLSQRVSDTKSEVWPINKTTGSTKVTNLSIGSPTDLPNGALWMSSNPFYKWNKRPRIFPWNLSIWWSDVATACEDNKDLIKLSRGFTCWRFEETGFSVNNCSSVSLPGI